MLVGVYEEIWPWPIKDDSQPKIRGPVAAGDGHGAAGAIAKTMAEKFDRSEYVGDAAFAYWWGHNKGAPELYRYVMRAS